MEEVTPFFCTLNFICMYESGLFIGWMGKTCSVSAVGLKHLFTERSVGLRHDVARFWESLKLLLALGAGRDTPMAIFDLSGQQVAVPEIQLCLISHFFPFWEQTWFNHAIYNHAMIFVSFSVSCLWLYVDIIVVLVYWTRCTSNDVSDV
jgi:hypothetical protein